MHLGPWGPDLSPAQPRSPAAHRQDRTAKAGDGLESLDAVRNVPSQG